MKKILLLAFLILTLGKAAFALTINESENQTIPEGSKEQRVFVTKESSITISGNYEGEGDIYFFIGKSYYPYPNFDKMSEGIAADTKENNAFSKTIDNLQSYQMPLPVFAAQKSETGTIFSEVIFIDCFPNPPEISVSGNDFIKVRVDKEYARVDFSKSKVSINGEPVPFSVTKNSICFPVFNTKDTDGSEQIVDILVIDAAGHEVNISKTIYTKIAKPHNVSISRGELAFYLSTVLDLPNDGDLNGFSDRDYIPLDMRKHVFAVQNAGLIVGDNGYFNFDHPLSREMAATIAARATNQELKGADLEFTDKGDVSSWAYNPLCYAKQVGIINGYPDNTFKPGKDVSVKEAAQIIVNLINFINN